MRLIKYCSNIYMKKKRTISKNRSSYKKKIKRSKSKRKKRTKTKSRTSTIETTELMKWIQGKTKKKTKKKTKRKKRSYRKGVKRGGMFPASPASSGPYVPTEWAASAAQADVEAAQAAAAEAEAAEAERRQQQQVCFWRRRCVNRADLNEPQPCSTNRCRKDFRTLAKSIPPT